MKLSIIVCCFLLAYISSVGQYITRRAASQQEVYHYAAAAALYEKAYNKRATAANARAAANAYRQLRDYRAAETWYGKLAVLPEATATDVYYYGLALQQNGKYASAKEQFSRCLTMSGNPIPAAELTRLLVSCDSATLWLQSPQASIVTNASNLNSAYTDWGALKEGDQLFWVSDRPTGSRKKHFLKFSNGNPVRTDQYGWTDNNYLQLYQGKDSAATPIYFGKAYHTGMPSLRKDGLEMFFSQTHFAKKPRKFLSRDSAYSIYIETYSVSRATDTSVWSAPVPFRYNNSLLYSVGDPFITPDGKRLYFVSDMPGTTGGTDIYYSERLGDNNWGDAVKMGNGVNTAGQERSPYIDEDGTFYFSSDGHIGMGGLDIYRVENGQPVNVGAPLNSSADDLYFSEGYFTSNRMGGKGNDDIYRYEEVKKEEQPPVAVVKEDSPTKLPDPLPVEQPIRLIIYYDFDKATIKRDAARDLDQLAALLNEKPEIHIQLNAHTDARGKKAYNLALSQKRAQAAVNYLVAKGIAKSRMTARGYGEEKPVNGCVDGVSCTEAQHQENRRTEFEVDK
ncbi:OmpA family protein [Chitinophaga sp. SYP-B3965]|uniref:OmpA family protein n=1 Tax=Chitinophaga sp. SYP-B3965 TaxID=2663120 RepID=UPI001299DC8B|nr:OmpA family protein [Chitinophaga sp. SYP-B3965]MRG48905.1 OmpA family protein [Chitinophaga sp. SYP-B3965]